MIIKELNLIHFGKFHHFCIELGPHMNLIFGPNEAGKSTVYAFIYAMLFGMRRARGRAAANDMYTRYQPWDAPGSYEGTMTFEYAHQTYRLYRNFYKEDVRASLICLDTQKQVPLPHGVIGDLIPGLTEENYKNTVGVAQAHSETDAAFARSLQSQAANMAMTGSQNLHLGRALDYLKKERRSLKETKTSASAQQCRERLSELIQTRDKLKATLKKSPSGEAELTAQLAKLDLALGQCSVELGMILGELRPMQERLEQEYKAQAHETGAREGRVYETQERKVRTHEEQAHEAQEGKARAREEQAYEPQGRKARTHEERAHEAQEGKARAREEQAYETRGRKARTHEAQMRVHGKRAFSDEPERRRPVIVLGFTAAVLGVILGIFALTHWEKLSGPAAAAIFAGCIVLLIFGITGCIFDFAGRRGRGVESGSKTTHHAADDTTDDKNGDTTDDTAGAGNTSQTQQLLQRIDVLKARQAGKLEQRQQLEQKKQELTARLARCRQTQAHQASVLEQYNETVNMIEDCQEMLDQMTAQLQEQQWELTCIDQASQLIETLAGEIHEHFGGRLWEASARLMQELTGQDRSFKVQPDLKILVDNSRTLIPLERLSRAAMEQFYLAVRLGAASLLFGDEAMPLVLDDTFAYYDDERLKTLLSWLAERRPGQLLLFCCQHREETLLDHMNIDYNYVNLT